MAGRVPTSGATPINTLMNSVSSYFNDATNNVPSRGTPWSNGSGSQYADETVGYQSKDPLYAKTSQSPVRELVAFFNGNDSPSAVRVTFPRPYTQVKAVKLRKISLRINTTLTPINTLPPTVLISFRDNTYSSGGGGGLEVSSEVVGCEPAQPNAYAMPIDVNAGSSQLVEFEDPVYLGQYLRSKSFDSICLSVTDTSYKKLAFTAVTLWLQIETDMWQ